MPLDLSPQAMTAAALDELTSRYGEGSQYDTMMRDQARFLQAYNSAKSPEQRLGIAKKISALRAQIETYASGEVYADVLLLICHVRALQSELDTKTAALKPFAQAYQEYDEYTEEHITNESDPFEIEDYLYRFVKHGETENWYEQAAVALQQHEQKVKE